MLNPFPELLAYGLLAPFILRVFVGIQLLAWGYLKLFYTVPKEKILVFEKNKLQPAWLFISFFGFIELISGGLLIIGLYTQYATMIASVVLLGTIILQRRHPEAFAHTKNYYILLFLISLSLLFSGAGAFAIDLPL